MDEFRNLTCKSDLKNCNIITPTQRSLYTNQHTEIQEIYKRICTTNDGVMSICCDPTVIATTAEGKAFFTSIKAKYPRIRINRRNNRNINNNGMNNKINTDIESVELFKPNAPNIADAKDELTPYILCKIANATIKPLNNFVDVATNLTADCHKDNCDNLEREITLNHILGKGGNQSNISYDRYIDDLKLAEYIAEKNEYQLREYIKKYNKVDHPLIHDENKTRIIHLVAEHNMTEGLNILIALDANINIKNLDGDTPLHIALRNDAITIIEKLLQQGANTTEKNNAGEIPIFSAINTKPNIPVGNKLRNIRIMYNGGSSLFAVDAKYNNLLHYSIIHLTDANDLFETVNYLIKNGVDLMRKNANGQLPLDLIKDTDENQSVITLMRNMMFKQKYNSNRGTFKGSIPVGAPIDIDTNICFGKPDISPDLNKMDCIQQGGQFGKASLANIQMDIEYPASNVDNSELYDIKEQTPIVINTLPEEIKDLNNTIEQFALIDSLGDSNYFRVGVFMIFGILGFLLIKKQLDD